MRLGTSEQSNEANRLLAESGFEFETVDSPHSDTPVLFTPGGSFRGVEGIQIYIAISGDAQ